MKHQYESEILYHLMERDGLNIPSSVPPYESEIKAYLINQVKLAYPKLTDYEAEWLLYNYTKHLPAEFPISSVSNVTNATFENVVPFAFKSAILKGSTKYRDIDTGEVLDAFEDGRNLELVSVRMPVLTTTGKNLFDENKEKSQYYITSNGEYAEDEYGYQYINQEYKVNGVVLNAFRLRVLKSTANTISELKEYLHSNPIVVQYELAEKSIKTVDLSTVNEKGESTYFMPLEGTMHVSCKSETIQPTFDMSVPVEATTQNLASFINLEMEG